MEVQRRRRCGGDSGGGEGVSGEGGGRAHVGDRGCRHARAAPHIDDVRIVRYHNCTSRGVGVFAGCSHLLDAQWVVSEGRVTHVVRCRGRALGTVEPAPRSNSYACNEKCHIHPVNWKRLCPLCTVARVRCPVQAV